MFLRTPGRAVARILVMLVVSLSAGTTAVALAPGIAFASSYDLEAQFIAKMNAARQSAGMAPYAVASDLSSIARQHSAEMASRQSLYHNPSLTSDVQNWRAVGENVGEGPTVSDIHTAFMNSPEHRANILDHDFTQVGVGVTVDKNGMVWVTEDFRQPMSGTSSSAPTHHSSGSTSSSSPTSSPARSSAPSPARGTTTQAPRPSPSPREVLRHRLHELRSHRSRAADPVAQSFAYVSALSALTR